MIPGEYVLQEDDIMINEEGEITELHVINKGDRPIQVGSHYHFYEVNEALAFDKEKAYGKRLSIPAGAAVRFEPGDEKEVLLIDFKGTREVYGFHNEVDGPLEGVNVHEFSDVKRAICTNVRTDNRRFGSFSRYRFIYSSGKRLHDVRRGSCLWRWESNS